MIIISPGFQSLIKTNLFFLLKKVILKLQEINIEKCRNFGWSTGSTNTKIANILPEIREPVSFVDTTGSLRNDLSFNPLLGLNTLSKKTQGKCYHLGAPYIFPSLSEKNKFFNEFN